VHLHEGPKVVHRYDLQRLAEGVGVYHLRSRVRAAADEPAVD
jgi:hypothetical protein